MDDLIGRQAAIDETWFEPSYTDPSDVLGVRPAFLIATYR